MIKIVKVNGETYVEEAEGNEIEDASSYSMNSHRINLKELPDFQYRNFDIEEANSKIEYMLSFYKKNKISVENVYKEIISMDNIEDVIGYFIEEYADNYKSRKKLFDRKEYFDYYYKSLNKTLYFSITKIVKKIIGIYFKNIVSNMQYDNIFRCNQLLKKGTSKIDFLNSLEIPFSETAEKYGIKEISAMAFASEINDNVIERREHLCGNCPAEIRDCPKLLDYQKRKLDKYEFIRDGIQKANDKNQLIEFLVYSCDIYDKAIKQKKKIK